MLDYLTYWNTLNTPPLPEERIKLAVKNIWRLEARKVRLMTDADMAGLDAEWEEARKKRNGDGADSQVSPPG